MDPDREFRRYATDDRYEYQHIIYSGSREKAVCLCRERKTDVLVAVKVMRFEDRREGFSSEMIREIALLKELDHENIVRLLDVRTNGEVVKLVFEYLPMDLAAFIRKQKINSLLRKRFLYQIISAMSYCHSLGILHRDMKPRNVLVDDQRKVVKIGDFGLARTVDHPRKLSNHQIVTDEYLAPEVILGSDHYTAAVDIWSVGCIFAEMVNGRPLFPGLTSVHVLKKIFSFLGIPDQNDLPGVSNLTTYRKIAPEPMRDLRDAVHGLEQEGYDLLSKMLCLDPAARLSADAALLHPYFEDVSAAAAFS